VIESTAPPTILAIDDDLGLLMCLGLVLTEAGLQVVPSVSTEEALALAEELNLHPDLLVANAELLRDQPALDGIISRSRQPGRAVAIVSAGETAAPRLPAGLVGAGLLQRPLDPAAPPREEWLGVVRRALAGSHTGEAA
jgi:DNA-binding response OmpR family regulator